jgi:hypothetical protein
MTDNTIPFDKAKGPHVARRKDQKLLAMRAAFSAARAEEEKASKKSPGKPGTRKRKPGKKR